ncbi:MAG: HypC/HybG/HupF family hydrogenase formation chaperone [Desulfurococcaceae archaeon]|uniref:HypC/HybG/HupF family hydrogenase formation chaperone n=1 Tax=Staphylothermus marinus TaxID=2280 RepID=A0A7C4D7W9_STAMA
MCLGIPGEVISIHDERGVKIGVVRIGGVLREVIIAVENVKPGDYVIVHAGVAIEKIDEKELKELTELLSEAGFI